MLMTLVCALTGVKMVFAHDTEAALISVAALVNTAGRDGEKLPDVAALDVFLDAHIWTGRRERSRAELDAVRALRPRLRRFWEVDEDELVEIVNAAVQPRWRCKTSTPASSASSPGWRRRTGCSTRTSVGSTSK